MRKTGVFVLCLAVFMFLCASSASAVDVKFSGSFDVTGIYEAAPFLDNDEASTAFFHQRLKVKTVFEVAPGLSLTTAFSALDRVWGDNSWGGTRGNTFGRPSGTTNDYDRLRENIEFHEAYVTYDSGKMGTFIAGIVPHDTQWGTIWGTSERYYGIIQWRKAVGDFGFGLKYLKNNERSTTYKRTADAEDVDSNVYVANVTYKKGPLFAGMKWAYLDGRDMRPRGSSPTPPPGGTSQWKTTGHLLTPFAILDFGAFKIEAEMEHFTGKRDFEGGGDNIDMQTWAAYVNAEFTKGPVSVGATMAYASGDDPSTRRMEALPDSSFTSWGGLDYNPGLILWNEDRNEYRGALGGAHLSGTGYDYSVRSGVSNARMVSIYGSYRPTDKWDIKLVWLFARADERPQIGADRFVSKSYGHEADLIVTYNITNNLKYMVGAAYLWTGDYFKGTSRDNSADDDYLFTNKLSLTF